MTEVFPLVPVIPIIFIFLLGLLYQVSPMTDNAFLEFLTQTYVISSKRFFGIFSHKIDVAPFLIASLI